MSGGFSSKRIPELKCPARAGLIQADSTENNLSSWKSGLQGLPSARELSRGSRCHRPRTACEGWEGVLLPTGTRYQPLSSGRFLSSMGEELPCCRGGGPGVQGALWFGTSACWLLTSFTSKRVRQSCRQRLDLSCITMEHGASRKSKAELSLHASPQRQSLESIWDILRPAPSPQPAAAGQQQQLAPSRSPQSPKLSTAAPGDGATCWQNTFGSCLKPPEVPPTRYFSPHKTNSKRTSFTLCRDTTSACASFIKTTTSSQT